MSFSQSTESVTKSRQEEYKELLMQPPFLSILSGKLMENPYTLPDGRSCELEEVKAAIRNKDQENLKKLFTVQQVELLMKAKDPIALVGTFPLAGQDAKVEIEKPIILIKNEVLLNLIHNLKGNEPSLLSRDAIDMESPLTHVVSSGMSHYFSSIQDLKESKKNNPGGFVDPLNRIPLVLEQNSKGCVKNINLIEAERLLQPKLITQFFREALQANTENKDTYNNLDFDEVLYFLRLNTEFDRNIKIQGSQQKKDMEKYITHALMYGGNDEMVNSLCKLLLSSNPMQLRIEQIQNEISMINELLEIAKTHERNSLIEPLNALIKKREECLSVKRPDKSVSKELKGDVDKSEEYFKKLQAIKTSKLPFFAAKNSDSRTQKGQIINNELKSIDLKNVDEFLHLLNAVEWDNKINPKEKSKNLTIYGKVLQQFLVVLHNKLIEYNEKRLTADQNFLLVKESSQYAKLHQLVDLVYQKFLPYYYKLDHQQSLKMEELYASVKSKINKIATMEAKMEDNYQSSVMRSTAQSSTAGSSAVAPEEESSRQSIRPGRY